MSRRTSSLYRAARVSADVDAVRRHRVGKRLRNRIVGRLLFGAFRVWR